MSFQPSPPSSGTGYSTGMASLSDGSTVVGVVLQGTTPRVERVSGAGVVDTGFHNAAATTFGAFPPEAVATTSDDHIVVAGAPGGASCVAVRVIDGSGTRDPGFAAGGDATATGPTSCDVAKVAVDNQGRILVLFLTDTGSSPTQPNHCAVERFAGDGTLDTVYSASASAALATIPYQASVSAGCRAVLPLTDGRVIVATGWAVVRLAADGTLDSGYGTGGATIRDESYDGLLSAALSPDGSVILGSTTYNGNPGFRFSVSRLTPAGEVDTSFGTSGRAAIAFADLEPEFAGNSPTNSARLISVDRRGDGTIVVVGSTRAGIGFARLTSDGKLPSAFLAFGRVVVRGTDVATIVNGSAPQQAVLLPSGDLEVAFGWNALIPVNIVRLDVT